jgi:uncharacterized protein DUF433
MTHHKRKQEYWQYAHFYLIIKGRRIKWGNILVATIQSINLISTNPQVRSGRPCIAGTTVEVSVIVIGLMNMASWTAVRWWNVSMSRLCASQVWT